MKRDKMKGEHLAILKFTEILPRERLVKAAWIWFLLLSWYMTHSFRSPFSHHCSVTRFWALPWYPQAYQWGSKLPGAGLRKWYAMLVKPLVSSGLHLLLKWDWESQIKVHFLTKEKTKLTSLGTELLTLSLKNRTEKAMFFFWNLFF